MQHTCAVIGKADILYQKEFGISRMSVFIHRRDVGVLSLYISLYLKTKKSLGLSGGVGVVKFPWKRYSSREGKLKSCKIFGAVYLQFSTYILGAFHLEK